MPAIDLNADLGEALGHDEAMLGIATSGNVSCGVHDKAQAAAMVAAVAVFSPGLPALGLPGSLVLRLAADAGLRSVAEVFADRASTADGTLAPRSQLGSVIHDPDASVGQALSIATQGWARTVDAGVTLAPFAP